MRNFNFGQNWKEYSTNVLNDDRIAEARRSLQDLLQQADLHSLQILDVGCGSGLFALAAVQLDAQVTGIDINPTSIETSKLNLQRFLPKNHVEFQTMSVLDESAMKSLGSFDVVYAWGSLHHTGEMWRAISIVCEHVNQQGRLVLAIYNRHITSSIWRMIKRIYNALPPLLQFLMCVFFSVIIYIAKFVVTRKNPLHKERGMNFWYDVVDWIGGYPYEYASPSEVIDFVSKKGFTLKKLMPAEVPTGCNEFVFAKL